MSVPEKKLKITSIFLSVNGECCKAGPGSFTIFVRTFGCSARCSYCDTKYSWDDEAEVLVTDSERRATAKSPYFEMVPGESHVEKRHTYQEMLPREVFGEIIKLDPGCGRVTLTGGEPLEQDYDALKELLTKLQELGYEVSIETNGMQMDVVKRLKNYFGEEGFLSFVVDVKLPSSVNPWNQIIHGGEPLGELTEQLTQRNVNRFIDGLLPLRRGDFLKFVISNKEDFDWAMTISNNLLHRLGGLVHAVKIYFSPCNISAPGLLFEWMKEAGCAEKDIGYSMQIHKIIFPGDWREEER